MDLWGELIKRLENSVQRQKETLERTEKQLEGARAAHARQAELALGAPSGKK